MLRRTSFRCCARVPGQPLKICTIIMMTTSISSINNYSIHNGAKKKTIKQKKKKLKKKGNYSSIR